MTEEDRRVLLEHLNANPDGEHAARIRAALGLPDPDVDPEAANAALEALNQAVIAEDPRRLSDEQRKDALMRMFISAATAGIFGTRFQAWGRTKGQMSGEEYERERDALFAEANTLWEKHWWKALGVTAAGAVAPVTPFIRIGKAGWSIGKGIGNLTHALGRAGYNLLAGRTASGSVMTARGVAAAKETSKATKALAPKGIGGKLKAAATGTNAKIGAGFGVVGGFMESQREGWGRAAEGAAFGTFGGFLGAGLDLASPAMARVVLWGREHGKTTGGLLGAGAAAGAAGVGYGAMEEGSKGTFMEGGPLGTMATGAGAVAGVTAGALLSRGRGGIVLKRNPFAKQLLEENAERTGITPQEALEEINRKLAEQDPNINLHGNPHYTAMHALGPPGRDAAAALSSRQGEGLHLREHARIAQEGDRGQGVKSHAMRVKSLLARHIDTPEWRTGKDFKSAADKLRKKTNDHNFAIARQAGVKDPLAEVVVDNALDKIEQLFRENPVLGAVPLKQHPVGQRLQSLAKMLRSTQIVEIDEVDAMLLRQISDRTYAQPDKITRHRYRVQRAMADRQRLGAEEAFNEAQELQEIMDKELGRGLKGLKRLKEAWKERIKEAAKMRKARRQEATKLAEKIGLDRAGPRPGSDPGVLAQMEEGDFDAWIARTRNDIERARTELADGAILDDAERNVLVPLIARMEEELETFQSYRVQRFGEAVPERVDEQAIREAQSLGWTDGTDGGAVAFNPHTDPKLRAAYDEGWNAARGIEPEGDAPSAGPAGGDGPDGPDGELPLSGGTAADSEPSAATKGLAGGKSEPDGPRSDVAREPQAGDDKWTTIDSIIASEFPDIDERTADLIRWARGIGPRRTREDPLGPEEIQVKDEIEMAWKRVEYQEEIADNLAPTSPAGRLREANGEMSEPRRKVLNRLKAAKTRFRKAIKNSERLYNGEWGYEVKVRPPKGGAGQSAATKGLGGGKGSAPAPKNTKAPMTKEAALKEIDRIEKQWWKNYDKGEKLIEKGQKRYGDQEPRSPGYKARNKVITDEAYEMISEGERLKRHNVDVLAPELDRLREIGYPDVDGWAMYGKPSDESLQRAWKLGQERGREIREAAKAKGEEIDFQEVNKLVWDAEDQPWDTTGQGPNKGGKSRHSDSYRDAFRAGIFESHHDSFGPRQAPEGGLAGIQRRIGEVLERLDDVASGVGIRGTKNWEEDNLIEERDFLFGLLPKEMNRKAKDFLSAGRNAQDEAMKLDYGHPGWADHMINAVRLIHEAEMLRNPGIVGKPIDKWIRRFIGSEKDLERIRGIGIDRLGQQNAARLGMQMAIDGLPLTLPDVSGPGSGGLKTAFKNGYKFASHVIAERPRFEKIRTDFESGVAADEAQKLGDTPIDDDRLRTPGAKQDTARAREVGEEIRREELGPRIKGGGGHERFGGPGYKNLDAKTEKERKAQKLWEDRALQGERRALVGGSLVQLDGRSAVPYQVNVAREAWIRGFEVGKARFEGWQARLDGKPRLETESFTQDRMFNLGWDDADQGWAAGGSPKGPMSGQAGKGIRIGKVPSMTRDKNAEYVQKAIEQGIEVDPITAKQAEADLLMHRLVRLDSGSAERRKLAKEHDALSKEIAQMRKDLTMGKNAESPAGNGVSAASKGMGVKPGKEPETLPAVKDPMKPNRQKKALLDMFNEERKVLEDLMKDAEPAQRAELEADLESIKQDIRLVKDGDYETLRETYFDASIENPAHQHPFVKQIDEIMGRSPEAEQPAPAAAAEQSPETKGLTGGKAAPEPEAPAQPTEFADDEARLAELNEILKANAPKRGETGNEAYREAYAEKQELEKLLKPVAEEAEAPQKGLTLNERQQLQKQIKALQHQVDEAKFKYKKEFVSLGEQGRRELQESIDLNKAQIERIKEQLRDDPGPKPMAAKAPKGERVTKPGDKPLWEHTADEAAVRKNDEASEGLQARLGNTEKETEEWWDLYEEYARNRYSNYDLMHGEGAGAEEAQKYLDRFADDKTKQEWDPSSVAKGDDTFHQGAQDALAGKEPDFSYIKGKGQKVRRAAYLRGYNRVSIAKRVTGTFPKRPKEFHAEQARLKEVEAYEMQSLSDEFGNLETEDLLDMLVQVWAEDETPMKKLGERAWKYVDDVIGFKGDRRDEIVKAIRKREKSYKTGEGDATEWNEEKMIADAAARLETRGADIRAAQRGHRSAPQEASAATKGLGGGGDAPPRPEADAGAADQAAGGQAPPPEPPDAPPGDVPPGDGRDWESIIDAAIGRGRSVLDQARDAQGAAQRADARLGELRGQRDAERGAAQAAHTAQRAEMEAPIRAARQEGQDLLDSADEIDAAALEAANAEMDAAGPQKFHLFRLDPPEGPGKVADGRFQPQLGNADDFLAVKRDLTRWGSEFQKSTGRSVPKAVGEAMGALQKIVQGDEAADMPPMSPEYAVAENAASANWKPINAVDRGREAAGPKTRATDAMAEYSRMSQRERDGYRAGWFDEMAGKAETMHPAADATAALRSEKGAAISEGFAENPSALRADLDAERQVQETSQRIRGQRASDRDEIDLPSGLGQGARAMQHAVQNQPFYAAANVIGGAPRFRGGTRASRARLEDALLETGRASRFEMAMEYAIREEEIARRLARAGVIMGASPTAPFNWPEMTGGR